MKTNVIIYSPLLKKEFIHFHESKDCNIVCFESLIFLGEGTFHADKLHL